jgi:hypothetical protein
LPAGRQGRKFNGFAGFGKARLRLKSLSRRRPQNQLVKLIFSDLPTFSVGIPKEEYNREHYTPVSERNAPGVDLVGADKQEGSG